MKSATLAPWVSFLAAAGLSACLSGGDDTGILGVSVSDAPVDGATAVVVQFTGVEIKGAGRDPQTFDFPTPRQVDLLSFQGNASAALLDGVQVPAGTYEWVRLKVNAQADGVDDSYIDLSDGRHELTIPSGAETGLKLNNGFVVPAGGTANFTIDFDLRKSVHQPSSGSDYVLRPTLRIVDNARVGAIAGNVDTTHVNGSGCSSSSAVYVFAGSGVTPDDDDGTAPDPVTTALVKLNTTSGLYEYAAGFLTQGTYTVAFTCNAASDDPDSNDSLTFVGTQTVTVTAGQTTTVNFGP